VRAPRLTDENRRWWVLATMTGSLSMILIDQTVVSVALPTMQRDLDLSTVGLQWVINAYLLAIAVFVALGGKLGDLLGNARIFRIGAALFVSASALCGFAQSEEWIIASRVLEGIGAALMTPATGAIVTNSFRPSERGRAMGVYAGVSMVFLALGPLIGGVLTEAISWRAVFFVNLPVGVVMLALARVTLRGREEATGGRMDWGGVPLIVLGLGCLVLALMQSRSWGWGSPQTIGLLAASVVLLSAMVWWELRAREPLVQLRLFANRNFTADNVVLAAVQFALMGVSVFGAIWVQNVLGFGPIEAGLSLLPLTLPLLVLAPRVGSLYDRIGPRLPVAAGALAVGAALAWNAIFLHERSYPWIVPSYLLMGTGLAFVMTPANTDAMNAAAARLRGQASGVIQTMRQVGGTIGIAVMGTVVANVQLTQITDVLTKEGATSAQVQELESALSQSGAAAASGATTPGGRAVPPEVVDGVKEAVTTAIAAAYWVAAGVMLLAALLAFALLRRQAPVDAEEAEESYAAIG
jgi:EmrB/QacA subfamily drug resistance transporter